MYVGMSIAMIAIGAILRYAVADALPGVSLPVIGLILMVVGAIGLVVSFVQMAMARDGGFRRRKVVEY